MIYAIKVILIHAFLFQDSGVDNNQLLFVGIKYLEVYTNPFGLRCGNQSFLYFTGCHVEFVMQFEGGRKDLQVKEGDNVILNCTVIGEDHRDQFQWYRYGADDAHEVTGVVMSMTNSYLKHRPNSHFTIPNYYDVAGNAKDVTFTMNITGNYTLKHLPNESPSSDQNFTNK